MQTDDKQHRSILQRIARRAMLDRGLLPDFSNEVLAELSVIRAPAAKIDAQVRDLRDLLWASIDNDDSRDLDQLTVAEAMPGDKVKILPEKLSTDLTSLNFNEERLAIVIEMMISADGSLESSDIYRARVRNHAKLAYNSVAAWLEGNGSLPEAIAAVEGLKENLRLQDKAAQSMKNLRHMHGALSLETVEARPVFDGDKIRGLEVDSGKRRERQVSLVQKIPFDPPHSPHSETMGTDCRAC